MAAKTGKFMIGLWFLLAASAIVVLEISFLESKEGAEVPENVLSENQHFVPSEEAMFSRAGVDYSDLPENSDARTMDEYYANRAYPGAPPYIPHEVPAGDEIGGRSCLKCHENGEYAPAFKAFAPVTPHPELVSCKQCHVPADVAGNFRESNFVKVKARQGESALDGSPPPMPHGLQMRENCLACHAGPAVPKAIRVTHPERLNCRQCHAQTDAPPIEWSRITEDQKP